ncbi:MAG: hypothetical protein WCG23_10270 [bacterium]
MFKKMFAAVVGGIGVGLNKKMVFKCHVRQLLKKAPGINSKSFSAAFIDDMVETYLNWIENNSEYQDITSQTDGLELYLLTFLKLIRPDIYELNLSKEEIYHCFLLQMNLLNKHNISWQRSLVL